MSETAAPFVGPPRLGEGCAYSDDLDVPLCGAAPIAHVRVRSNWGTVGLASCAEHLPTARTVPGSPATGEHAFGELCPSGTCLWIEDVNGA
jgi:hypothetical protein